VSGVRWGLVPRGRRGENERSLEKRIEGVERWFEERMRVCLKRENNRGKNCFQEVTKTGLRSPKKWVFIREFIEQVSIRGYDKRY